MSWARRVGHVLLGVVGLGGVLWLTHRVGAARTSQLIAASAGWFVLVWLLEGARIALDLVSTRLLLRHHVPWSVLVRAHLVAYPMVLLFPAGRLAGEALKASMLAPHAGVDRAAAAAVINQALPLLAGFVVSIPCLAVVAVQLTATHPLSIAVFVQTCTAIALATVILAASRQRAVGRALRRVSERVGAEAARTREHIVGLGLVPWPALGAHVCNRVLLGAQLVLLTVGVAAGGWLDGVLVFGAHLVGAAAGDLVPAQLGATDGALTLAATAIGISFDEAVAIALLVHAAQLLWAAIGGLAAWGQPQIWQSSSHSSDEQSSRSKMDPPGKPH